MINDYPFVIVSQGSLCSKMRQYLPNAMLVIERNIQFPSIAHWANFRHKLQDLIVYHFICFAPFSSLCPVFLHPAPGYSNGRDQHCSTLLSSILNPLMIKMIKNLLQRILKKEYPNTLFLEDSLYNVFLSFFILF